MGWFQILPVGCKSSQPFQFNMMHILPSSKIPFAKVPLDTMISTKLTFKKKKEKLDKDGKLSIHQAVHPNEKEATDMGLLLIDEFKFDHAIFQIGNGEFTTEGLQYGYKKLYNFLGLHKKTDAGLTVIVTQKWMYMSVVHQPYHREQEIDLPESKQDGGVPVYLDGFAYAGILNLQTCIQNWPATAGIGAKQHSILGALKLQATEVPKEVVGDVQLDDPEFDDEVDKIESKKKN